MLVVHDVPLVAEDLREALLGAGAGDVELARSLSDDPPAERYDTCFLAVPDRGPDPELSHAELIARAKRMARRVVFVSGDSRARSGLPPDCFVLLEPFRNDDVLRTMRKLHQKCRRLP